MLERGFWGCLQSVIYIDRDIVTLTFIVVYLTTLLRKQQEKWYGDNELWISIGTVVFCLKGLL
jgi:hypothetical protein